LEAIEDLNRSTGDWAVTFDLTTAYHQCELAPAVREYYCFRVGEQYYRMTRMPMGEVPSPGIMQGIVSAIATEAARGTGVIARAYIDNVRFMGSQEAVCLAASRFRDVCARCGVTLNAEPYNTPHQTGPFLGIEFDYKARTVAIGPRLRAKLEAANLHTCTNDDLCTTFGALYHASRILRINMAEFYFCMKYYRKRVAALLSGALHGSDCASIWPSILRQFTRWLDTATRNVPVSVTPRLAEDAPYALATDASDLGWGAVLFCRRTGRISTIGGKWAILVNKHK